MNEIGNKWEQVGKGEDFVLKQTTKTGRGHEMPCYQVKQSFN